MTELKNCDRKQKFGESICSSVQLRENSTIINGDNFDNGRSMHYHNKIILRNYKIEKRKYFFAFATYY